MPTFSIAKPSKIYPNWDFGLKIYHLATLVRVIIIRVLQICEQDKKQKRFETVQEKVKPKSQPLSGRKPVCQKSVPSQSTGLTNP
jgi:hypothetical protein